jgi:hypothetical protein
VQIIAIVERARIRDDLKTQLYTWQLPRRVVSKAAFTFTCRRKKKIRAHTRTYNLEVLASKKSLSFFFFYKSGGSYTGYLIILCDFSLDDFLSEIGKYVHVRYLLFAGISDREAWLCRWQTASTLASRNYAHHAVLSPFLKRMFIPPQLRGTGKQLSQPASFSANAIKPSTFGFIKSI